MAKTIYESSVTKGFLQPTARLFLRLLGWGNEGDLVGIKQAVIIGAHHTSNWDFVLGVLYAFYHGFTMHWMGKDSLFRYPFGGVFKWFGGIPIDRSRSKNMVEASVREFVDGKIRYLLIAPEGTRKKVERWKSGFYHIAHGAKVPIVLGFLDYKRKIGGFGPSIVTTGNMEADMERIQEFYIKVTAKRPEKAMRW